MCYKRLDDECLQLPFRSTDLKDIKDKECISCTNMAEPKHGNPLPQLSW